MRNFSLLKNMGSGFVYPALEAMPDDALKGNLSAVEKELRRKGGKSGVEDYDFLLDLKLDWTAELERRGK